MIKKNAGTIAGLYLLTLITLLSMSCGQRKVPNSLPESELQHHMMNGLTDVIVHDILSPPVASRIYAYSTLAFHEALVPGHSEMRLLTSAFKGFDALPEAPKVGEADFRLSATVAFFTVARKLVFSKDSLNKYEESAMATFDSIPDQIRERSVAWGKAVAACIFKRADNDNYRQTRSMPRFSVFGEPGKWQQTPPDYTDATEPHWPLIRPLMLDSASQCRPLSPPAFDTLEDSEFGRELREVYQVNQQLTPSMDSIARFWDDNPFVSQHVGHLTYATKKLTPVGHWMGIAEILCRQRKEGEALTAMAYAATAAAIFDGFISCWEEKYRSNKVRPVTAIRQRFDSEWSPLLQTPSFPEYTSGHSVITAAAATVLTHIFGDTTSFEDTTEMEYLGMTRRFSSIEAAADEAGISRLYGGIHFRSAIVNGKVQGNQVGRLFLPLLQKRGND